MQPLGHGNGCDDGNAFDEDSGVDGLEDGYDDNDDYMLPVSTILPMATNACYSPECSLFVHVLSLFDPTRLPC